MTPVASIRKCLAGAHHPGLVLDRYVAALGDKNDARDTVHAFVAASTPSKPYTLAYQRWEQSVRNLPGATTAIFETTSPLAIGLGNETVLETGITVQHTYGMPMIPGSALKGLAASVAKRHPAQLTDDHRTILFGSTVSAAYITYFDAWYIPGSLPDDRPFHPDVITVHHPDYYGRRPHPKVPGDLDEPTPIHYLNAIGSYLIVTRCAEDPEWAQLALDLITYGLEHDGIGGKTSSGYGRMKMASNRMP